MKPTKNSATSPAGRSVKHKSVKKMGIYKYFFSLDSPELKPDGLVNKMVVSASGEALSFTSSTSSSSVLIDSSATPTSSAIMSSESSFSISSSA